MSYPVFREQEALGRTVGPRQIGAPPPQHVTIPSLEEKQLPEPHLARRDVPVLSVLPPSQAAQSAATASRLPLLQSQQGLDAVSAPMATVSSQAAATQAHISQEDIRSREAAQEWLQKTPGSERFVSRLDVRPYLSHPYIRQRLEYEDNLRKALEIQILGPGGLVRKFGFHDGTNGAAVAALDALLQDTLGAAGNIQSMEDCIVNMHAATFASYNIWAMSVGGRPVTSFHHRSRAEVDEKLADLCLWYLIKTEAANLRFCPELLCWIHHQMRDATHYVMPTRLDGPSSAYTQTSTHSAGLSQGDSFFFTTTIQPLYKFLQNAAPSKGRVSQRWYRTLCPCSSTPDKEYQLPNSHRCNYDDLNELFWNKDLLRFAYHNVNRDTGVHNIGPLRKSFKERANYVAVLLNFFPWWLFLAVLFHAILGIARGIVNNGGDGLQDIGKVGFGEAIENASQCMLTLAAGKVLQIILVVALGRSRSIGGLLFVKILYHGAWTAALFLVYFILGPGNAVWWTLVILRLLFVAVGNGFFHSILSLSWLAGAAEHYASDVEKVHTAVPHGGPLAGNLLRQNIAAVIMYTALWTFLLCCKIVFDIQVMTQTLRSTTTISSLTLDYTWGLTTSGAGNVWISVGLWIMTALLFCIDSYIAYSVLVPLVGAFIVWVDGIGRVRTWGQVERCLQSCNPSSMHGRHAATTVRMFVSKFFPDAIKCATSVRECQQACAQSQPADAVGQWLAEAAQFTAPWFLFSRTWNMMIVALREEDLISDYELSMLTFGAGRWSTVPQWPLWLCHGQARQLFAQSAAIQQVARSSAQTDDFDARLQFVDSHAADSLKEVVLSYESMLTFAAILHQDFDQAIRGVISRYCRQMQEMLADRKQVGLVHEWHVNVTISAQNDQRYMSLQLALQHLNAENISIAIDVLEAIYGLSSHMLDLEHPVHSPTGENPIFSHAVSAIHKSVLLASRIGTAEQSFIHDAERLVAFLKSPSDQQLTLLQKLEAVQANTAFMSFLGQIHRCQVICSPSTIQFSLSVREAERRIAFWMNSLFMHALPMSRPCLEMSTFCALTPQYAEAVIYEKTNFLEKVNDQGVSPMIYLQSLHTAEWRNFLERVGVGADVDFWAVNRDPIGNVIDGAMEARLWASMRGQTLARTVRGVMEYPRAYRFKAYHELQISMIQANVDRANKQWTETGSFTNMESLLEQHGHIMLSAAISAEWLTIKKIAYVCCCQKYADTGAEDLIRRADIDVLMGKYPLLRVAYFEDVTDPATQTKKTFSVCVNSDDGNRIRLLYRIPLPGHPIRDGLGEGKPENQNNGVMYCPGRIVQVLDMNQAGYMEEAMKLPQILQEFEIGSTWKRPVALVGTREHVFTQGLSTPALFMSYQELQFGVVWQRIMYKPMRVRLHYGHPDFVDKVFMSTRGGFAKASRVINVSEDVFAGINATLRGGESKHVEYLQMGKGRDIGMLQIAQFEAKVSGGSAISLTTRDSARLFNNIEFFRMLSLWHTWAGYYVTNVIVSLATAFFLYFYCILAIAGIDGAIFSASGSVRLVGDVLIINWVSQLGGLFLIPVFFFLLVELGIIRALWQSLHMIFTLGPLFYVAEMQTKAYYFDQALSFGKQVYLATGRDFVIRHVSFAEIYRATAFSHLYFGAELLFVMILILVYGQFEGVVSFVFFFAASWVYILSILLVMFWFNPFALELQSVIQDARSWWQWVKNTRGDNVATSHSTWLKESTGAYACCPTWTRWYHGLRLLRFPAICAALLYRTEITHASTSSGVSEGIAIAAMFLLPLLLVAFIQLAYVLSFPGNGTQQSPATKTSKWIYALGSILSFAIIIAALVLLIVFGAANSGTTGGDVVLIMMIFLVMIWFTAKLIIVANVTSLIPACWTVLKCYDIFLGLFILSIQVIFAAIPYGASSHNALLFAPRYARTLESILGAHR